MELIVNKGEEITITMDNMAELEDKMELALENPDWKPQDMIDIVLETIAENGVIIR